MEETTSGDLLRVLPALVGILFHVAMLAVPLYCIIKRPTAPAYVMLVGEVVGMPGAFFSAWFNVWGIHANLPLEEVSRYFGVMGVISNIGALMFACGFLLFLHDALRKRVSI
jgi:hypothetical protein